MTTIIAFLIKDADEDEQAGVVATVDIPDFNYNDLRVVMNTLMYHPEFRDKFDLPMGDYEPVFDLTCVNEVAIGRFTYTNVTRRNFASIAANALKEHFSNARVVVSDPAALARIIVNTNSQLSLTDFDDSWRGLTVIHLK